MTPKEKALELIDKFENYSFINIDESISSFESAKQCALIAVNEIINECGDKCMFSKADYFLKVKEKIKEL